MIPYTAIDIVRVMRRQARPDPAAVAAPCHDDHGPAAPGLPLARLWRQAVARGAVATRHFSPSPGRRPRPATTVAAAHRAAAQPVSRPSCLGPEPVCPPSSPC